MIHNISNCSAYFIPARVRSHKRRILGKILFYCSICIYMISCSDICGDLFDRSPEQLIKENEFVVLGKFVGSDTIANLGFVDYLGDKSEFLIFEYSFQTSTSIKESKPVSKIYLWNCERIELKDGYSSVIAFDENNLQLVYGKQLESFKEVINVMTPIAPVDELKKLLLNKATSYRWNSIKADSVLVQRILAKNNLESLFNDRNNSGIILYGTDSYLATFSDFRSGKLCYYDEHGWGNSVDSKTYLEHLKSKTAVKL